MDPIKVIVNPYSGRGAGKRAIPKIQETLAAAGVPFHLEETTAEGEGIAMARQARLAGYEIVAAAGGDGTVSEVVNGLAQATPEGETVATLAILPVGSGNDFSDMLGASRQLTDAARAIAAGKTRRVDLCYAHIKLDDQELTRYFDNNLGAGVEAQVTIESRKIERLRGILIYLVAILKTLRNYTQPVLDVTWTDEAGRAHRVAQPSLLVSLGNSRRTGGGFYITPDAVIDDGLMDMGLVQALSTPRILALLPKVMVGAHRNHPAIRLVRCTSVQISADRPMPVHADGEVLTKVAREIEAVIQPQRLQVIAHS